MSSILVSAVAGAVGGAIGAGVAWLLGRTMKRKPDWLRLVPVFFLVFAVGLTRTLQPSVGERIMTDLDHLASIQTVKTHYPDDYRRLRERVYALSGSSSAAEAGRAVNDIFLVLAKRQRPKADPETSYALYQVSRAEAHALRAVNPADCAMFMEGRGAPTSLPKAITPELMTQDAAATSRLLEQTATRPAPPAPPMSMDQLAKLSFEAVSTLPDKDQDVVIALLKEERDPATPEEARVMCDFDIALADTILSRPQPTAGALVRALWAAQ